MKKFCVGFLTLLAVVFLTSAGCSLPEVKLDNSSVDTLTLMTWNVHNLFDGVDNGFEYPEFLQSSGWSTEKYLGRINSLSAAINTLKPKPDIIMFQEVENLDIMNDLAFTISNGFEWSHFANNPGAALGVGLISRLPVLEAMSHSITVNSDTTPRPVLEVRVQAGDSEFVLFICHWKSKLGGDAATESVRRASARVIVRRIRELWEINPDLGVIVAGDLNENHDEFYKQNAAMICALLPDDPYCAQLTGCIGNDGEENAFNQKDFIVLSRNKPPEPVHFPQDSIVLFSPWMSDLDNGTYFYRYNWETIDHFLISGQFFTNSGWDYEQSLVANFSPFISANGTPISYNMRTGTGLSDHLPLLLTLKLINGD
jgi:endonuclease/exonuclease/phosphatase family metal-dependent hydrolase